MISIETLGFFTGVGFAAGFVVGHLTRGKFICPAGREDGRGFTCPFHDQVLLESLKPDAQFEGLPVTTGATQSSPAQPVVEPTGGPSIGFRCSKPHRHLQNAMAHTI